MQPKINIHANGLHKKQILALTSPATEILYGGAAGGGKSHLMRCAAIMAALEIAGIQIYLFRRIFQDLKQNHIEGAYGFRAMLSDAVEAGIVTFRNDETEIRFNNGSAIYLCHCQHEKDKYKYQGAEIHFLIIDELTHFTDSIYRFLRGRVRMTGVNLPDKYKQMFPRIMCGSNPGNIGHAWVKEAFLNYQPPMAISKTPLDEGGMLRQFIPALLEDNPALLDSDPSYLQRLQGLGSPELVEAMRYGNWDIAAGVAFEMLNRKTHMLRQFKPPAHWLKFMSIDWGSSKPFAVGWFTVADQNTRIAAKDSYPDMIIPKGAIVMYREHYGWGGKADVGTRQESPEIAKEILQIEAEANEKIDYRIGDSAMWSKTDAPSVQERMYSSTGGKFKMEQSHKDRQANYHEMRTRLKGEDGLPMFYITENCKHFWRTVPDLVLDEREPEKGADSRQEDHILDAVLYALASRPMIVTEYQRFKTQNAEIEEKKRKMLRGRN